MKNLMGTMALVVMALACGRLTAQSTAEVVRVKVYDYARLDGKTMQAAEAEAARLLSDAGVAPEWVDCPTAHADVDLYPACPAASQATDVVLRFMPNAMAARTGQSADVLGSAAPCGGGGCPAAVFCDRVHELVGGGTAPFDVLMGKVIAHELGHLLLGTEHTRSGIMMARWSDRELSSIDGQEMRFSPQQRRQASTSLAAWKRNFNPEAELVAGK